jgi:hypothetical protein
MPDYTEGLGTPNITALDTTTPADTETVANLPAAIRQIKNIIREHLETAHEPETGRELSGNLPVAAIQVNTISGTNDNDTDAAPGKIKQGTVSAPDLKDGSVLETKLATSAVTTAKIADDAITLAKMADDSVDSDQIVDGSIDEAHISTSAVTETKLADSAVTTAKLDDDAVTSQKIADDAVSMDKLAGSPTNGQILVGNITGDKFQIKTLSGDATLDENGVLRISGSRSLAHIRLRERVSSGTSGGTSVGSVDLTATSTLGARGSTSGNPWEKSGSHSNLVTVMSDGDIRFDTPADTTTTVMVEVSVPGYAVGKHKCVLEHFDESGNLVNRYYGSSEIAPAGTQSRTTVRTTLTIEPNHEIRVRHYVETGSVAHGWGIATGAAGVEEVYAEVNVLIA